MLKFSLVAYMLVHGVPNAWVLDYDLSYQDCQGYIVSGEYPAYWDEEAQVAMDMTGAAIVCELQID